ncbi:hypothetical protein D1159_18825, partial [Pseudoflavonifractor sp. 524-17]|uniref:hypothetical protein n=1 Tax=Pseudoflavonifractor sp. 524-17 TaxID=2304577 RepID=UPI001379D0EE
QELDEIDRQLSELGVEEIDPKSIDLASHPELAPFVMADGNNADYQWTNTTKQVIYKGKRYMVSNLTVWPNSRNSKLYFDGTKVMYASPDKAAGTLALMKSLIMTYAGLSTIAGTALNFIDLVATQTSAQLSSSTIIEDVTAVYQWMLTEYVTFQYVRESGTSDERLCFTFNRVEGPQKCDVHQVKFNGKKVEMGFQTAEYKIAAIDFDQTDTYHAISAYLSTYEPTTKFIKEIDILGIDNQKVAAIPMLLPIGPGVLI